MGKIRYIVHYGAPFAIQSKKFDTEHEARKFIASCVFGDLRYCRLEKVEELEANFDYMEHYKIKDKKLSDEMFKWGIVSKSRLKESEQKEEV